ncbi:carbohydrate deacetylase isoform X2 [Petromyzon marinus]
MAEEMSEPRVVRRRRRLLVVCDDMGYCPQRNRGIVECFLAGLASGASLIVNGRAAEDAARLAKTHRMPLGLHANVTEGEPVCQTLPRSGRGLLLPGGTFRGMTGFREAMDRGDIDPKELEMELTAQMDRFRELTGSWPRHVDGHQHFHVHPGACVAFARVLRACGTVSTRVPVEACAGGAAACPWIWAEKREFFSSVEREAGAARAVFSQHGLRWARAFVGMSTMGAHMTLERLRTALAAACEQLEEGPVVDDDGEDDGATRASMVEERADDRPTEPERHRAAVIELMAHPGYRSEGRPDGVAVAAGCGPDGPDEFSMSEEREHEMRTLARPELAQFLTESGIRLCSFEDL